jgi:hypothetical protein
MSGEGVLPNDPNNPDPDDEAAAVYYPPLPSGYVDPMKRPQSASRYIRTCFADPRFSSKPLSEPPEATEWR